MNQTPHYRRGDPSPVAAGLFFWSYKTKRGRVNEYWVTAELFAGMQLRHKQRVAEQKALFDQSERPRFKKWDTTPDHPGKVFWAYASGRETWATPEQAERWRFRANELMKAARAAKMKDPVYAAQKHGVRVAHAAKNRSELNRKARERRANNIEARLGARLRARIRDAVVRQSAIKCATTAQLMGCSIQELRVHIESLFTDGMCWERIGEIDIDHVLPMALFNLEYPAQQYLACNFRNLRPMWKADNRSKNDKIEVDGKMVRVHELRKQNIIPFQAAA